MDKIFIKTRDGKQITGIRLRSNDEKYELIKLESGYDIAIKKSNIVEQKLIEQIEESSPLKPTHFEQTGKKIFLLSTGGTISSKVDYRTGAVNTELNPDELLELIPEVRKIGQIHAKSVFNLLSENMRVENWQGLANAILDSIKEGAEHIVITHGTDTMHYTAAALSFMIQNPSVPIILTGSQRSSDRGSSDTYINLLCSLSIANYSFNSNPVAICMHEKEDDTSCILINGVNARKMHSSKRSAFKSCDVPPLAHIDYPSLKFRRNWEPIKSNKSMKVDTRMNDNVALIQVHPNIKKELIRGLDKYDGIVFSGTGFGHIPEYILKEVSMLIESGISVAIAPQTIFGRVNLNVYSAGRKMLEIGVIGNKATWTPETALVKLMWVLGHEKDIKRVKKEMETNICGEIQNRLILEEGF